MSAGGQNKKLGERVCPYWGTLGNKEFNTLTRDDLNAWKICWFSINKVEMPELPWYYIDK